MSLEHQHQGYLYAVTATITGSLVYIFSKAALIEISLVQFGVYWFLFGFVWNSIFLLIKRRAINHFEKNWHNIKTLIFLGLIEIVATSTLYAAIFTTTDASIPSFLRNLEYVFVALLGVLLLREKFLKIEILGVVLTVCGALIISYDKGTTLKSYMAGTSGFMLVSSVFYAVRTIIAKTHIHRLSPTLLALNRAVFILLFSFICLLITSQSIIIPAKPLICIIIGSFFGPFLTSTFQYSALKYIDASKGAIIQSTTPLFVLIAGYFYFSKLPFMYQIFGGMLTIGGTFIMIIGKEFFNKNRLK